MPTPSSSLATQRPDLGASFMEFDLEADRQGFIGHQLLPATPVGIQSDTFGIIPLEQLLQQKKTSRSSGSRYNRGDWEFEDASYATKENGWEEPVDDRDQVRYRNYFDAEMIAAMRARDFVLRNAEIRIAALIFNTSTWTPTSVTNEWDDATNATPLDDVEAKVQAIYDASGIWPDTIAFSRKVFRNLRNTAQFKDRVASSGAGDSNLPGRVTMQQVAEFFDLPKVRVAGGAKNTANQGQAATIAEIWSNEYVWIGKTADTQDFKEACVGRTFVWEEYGGPVEGTFETYRDESVKSDIVRHRHETDEKLIYDAVGGLLDNITT